MNATVACPEWCNLDHTGEDPEDVFHHSERAMIVPPAGVGATEPQGVFTGVLRAELSVGPDPERPPVILVNFLALSTDGVDLDLAGADEMLAELDRYRAAFARLRDLLAEQSRR